MLTSFLLLPVGLVLLIVGANRFVSGAAATARGMGVSPLIIGLTVVGAATSAPEMLVGAVAAWQSKTCMAVGNAVGSNIANIGLVLGSSALVAPIYVGSPTLRKEYGLMFLAAVVGLCFLFDLHLARVDALCMIVILCLLLAWMVTLSARAAAPDPLRAELAKEHREATSLRQALCWTGVGLVLLLFGAELLVRGAVDIATHYGVGELLIGLTVVAVGTSLPELAATVVSAWKKEGDIAVGTVIGSNMFNSLAVTGVPGMIHPGSCPAALLLRDLPVMFGLTVLMGVMVFLRGRGNFSRGEGAILLTCFIAYQVNLYYAAALG